MSARDEVVAEFKAIAGKDRRDAPRERYAFARCVNCPPHIVYADDRGECRFCRCTDHRPPGTGGDDAA